MNPTEQMKKVSLNLGRGDVGGGCQLRPAVCQSCRHCACWWRWHCRGGRVHLTSPLSEWGANAQFDEQPKEFGKCRAKPAASREQGFDLLDLRLQQRIRLCLLPSFTCAARLSETKEGAFSSVHLKVTVRCQLIYTYLTYVCNIEMNPIEA